MTPLGFASWQLIATMIAGDVTKDNLLATMDVLFGEDAINGALATILPSASAVSFLLFYSFLSLFCNNGSNQKRIRFC